MLVCNALIVSAQANSGANDPVPNQGFLFTVQFAYHTPLFDMRERFQPFNAAGAAVYYKTKSNFHFGVDYDWFYGQKVKYTHLFDDFENDQGQITDEDGNYSIYRLNIRGHYLTANMGYLYRLNKKEPNSGIIFIAGTGLLLHRISIQAPTFKVPQVNGEYAKGYDHLTYGIATKQFIGYQRAHIYHRFRFRCGIEFTQGFTQGRRTWDFASNSSGKDDRFDGTMSLRFGVILPVYTKDADDEEFFID